MRVFIALDFEELKNYLLSIQEKIPKDNAKLSIAKSFHLTLKFLGDIPDDKIESIKKSLGNIKFEKFSLGLDEIGFFPDENYIRVVWIGVNPKNEVTDLYRKVEDSLKDFNFKKDFNFHPHITLAKVQFIKDKQEFLNKIKNVAVENKEIEINNFKLIKSKLTEKGPVYEDLAVF